MVQRHASDLKQAAQAVCDHTDREDLRTMASMYGNNLESEMRRTGRYDVTVCVAVAHFPSASAKGTVQSCAGTGMEGSLYIACTPCRCKSYSSKIT